MGDTTWCRGTVKSKEKVDGKGEVTIELVAMNQRQQVVAHGEALVELPL
jgi:hypothetical protein